MSDSTVIYYSSCKESSAFESKIIKSLKDNCGDLPIISVTQKPLDLGTNICVGEVGASGFNMFRQVQIACEQAKTKFVISAEADCLYPPEYFQFEPYSEDRVCRNTNLYIMGHRRDYFYHKTEGSTFSQITGREHYLKVLEEMFCGCPKWDAEDKNFPKGRHKYQDLPCSIQYFKTENPCVSFKTGKGMRHYTHSERVPIYSIPFWGDGQLIARRFYGKD